MRCSWLRPLGLLIAVALLSGQALAWAAPEGARPWQEVEKADGSGPARGPDGPDGPGEAVGGGQELEPAVQPVQTAALRLPAHDWRVPGFVAAVDGGLYDGWCLPLRSVGSNVPNLPFRADAAEVTQTLEWLRAHHFRWLRVFATGHALGLDRAPRTVADAVAALRTLLAQVEAFDAARPPEEAIYVLVALTDYYPPGVPGDWFGYDHPVYRGSPVLNAPWFRAGVRLYDFEQEHGFSRIVSAPNYEVNYLPWIRQVVPALASSPALMGWQLGNELKARNSPRNGISPDDAYRWYLDFTRDVVDTVRALDGNHLIFMGAQYVAELVDWAYRPQEAPSAELLPTYQRLVDQALGACGRFCWNVWGLTGYDFNSYPLDDAAAFARAGVASVMTEYGFTRGTTAEQQARFGGDRAVAVRSGLSRGWHDLDGRLQPTSWGVPELMTRAPLAGLAPWASPAPGPTAMRDMDSERGITLVPDEAALWSAWGDVAAELEAANRAVGVSADCLAWRSN